MFCVNYTPRPRMHVSIEHIIHQNTDRCLHECLVVVVVMVVVAAVIIIIIVVILLLTY